MRWLIPVVLVSAAAAVLPGRAAAAPACGPVTVETMIPAQVPVLDWAENLAYDRSGRLWVSRLQRNEVVRYDSAGNVTARLPMHSPGSIRVGPDGWLYALTGDTVTALALGTHDGTIVRWDPKAPNPVPAVVATGLAMPNGLAIDGAGNLYVADSGAGLLKFRADGSRDEAWNAQAPKPLDLAHGVNGMSFNGLALDGGALYLTMTQSLTGRLLRVPLDTPGSVSVVAELSGPLGTPAIVDDLAVGRDGQLYVATTGGALERVDPRTHAVCTVYQGQPVTAVAAVPGAAYQLAVATEGGDVLRITVP